MNISLSPISRLDAMSPKVDCVLYCNPKTCLPQFYTLHTRFMITRLIRNDITSNLAVGQSNNKMGTLDKVYAMTSHLISQLDRIITKWELWTRYTMSLCKPSYCFRIFACSESEGWVCIPINKHCTDELTLDISARWWLLSTSCQCASGSILRRYIS